MLLIFDIPMGSAPKVANGDILFFQKLQQLQLILKHFPSKYQKKKYTLQSHIFMGNPNLQKRNLKFINIDQSTFPQRGPRSTDNFHPESPKMRIFWEGPSRVLIKNNLGTLRDIVYVIVTRWKH